MLGDHINHQSENGIDFQGILVKTDFLDKEEAANLMNGLDEMPWDTSQSGRRKQVKMLIMSFNKIISSIKSFIELWTKNKFQKNEISVENL